MSGGDGGAQGADSSCTLQRNGGVQDSFSKDDGVRDDDDGNVSVAHDHSDACGGGAGARDCGGGRSETSS